MAITYVGGASSTSASSTSISVTHGLTINENDLVLAFIHSNANSVTILDNNGANSFTSEFQEQNPSTGGTGTQACFRRVAGASEPTSYSFNYSGTADRITLNVIVFDGVDVSAPGSDSHWDVKIGTSQRAFGESTNPATATALTTVANGAWGIGWFLNDSARTWSNYGNSYANEAEPVSADQANANVSREFATAGSQGTLTADLTSTGQDWVAHQFSIAPGVTGTTIIVPTGPLR